VSYRKRDSFGGVAQGLDTRFDLGLLLGSVRIVTNESATSR
jgi:hypothetical protein